MKKILAFVLVFALMAMPMAVSAERIELVNENPTRTINRAAVAPTIDGQFDERAYGERIILSSATPDDFDWSDGDTGIMDWLRTEANVGAWVSYDDNYFYVLLSGSSQHYFMDIDDPGSIWQHSGIQISVAESLDTFADDRLELGIARNSATGEILVNTWSDPFDWDIWEARYAVAIVGNVINYEIAIPWGAFGLDGVPSSFAWNFIYHFFYDDVRQIVEFAAGCAHGKDPSLFGVLNVSNEPTWVEPEPEEDEPAADDGAGEDAGAGEEAVVERPASPRTSDGGVIALIALMAIAALGIVVLRRKAVR